jgi:hypothetical protein
MSQAASHLFKEAQMIQQLIPTSSHTKTIAEFFDADEDTWRMPVEAWALVGIGEGQRVIGMVVDHDAMGLLTIEQAEKKYGFTFESFVKEPQQRRKD